LNFEFNVECYDADLARTLAASFDAKLCASTPVTLAELGRRSLPRRLRDGVARLASPFL